MSITHKKAQWKKASLHFLSPNIIWFYYMLFLLYTYICIHRTFKDFFLITYKLKVKHKCFRSQNQMLRRGFIYKWFIKEQLPRETAKAVARSQRGRGKKPHKGRIWGTVLWKECSPARDLGFHIPSPLNHWLRAAFPGLGRPSKACSSSWYCKDGCTCDHQKERTWKLGWWKVLGVSGWCSGTFYYKATNGPYFPAMKAPVNVF